MSFPLLAPVLAFAVSVATVLLLLTEKLQAFALDHPNERSLHAAPVPRTGGLAMLLGLTLGWLLAGPGDAWPALAGALALAAVSLLDDRRGLPVAARFAAHLLAAGAFVAFHASALPGTVWALAAVLFIGWITNLYNFMDGSDGLAGGMALFGFGSYAVAAWLGGHGALAAPSACVAAAAAGFLVFNFHPARIFMGDAGSVPLGFLAGAFGVQGWLTGAWPVWFPLLVFSPFIVDATVTLVKRAVRGERVWQAHREHYYQRLVRAGLGHRGTALLEYALMAAAGGSALWAMDQPPHVRAAVVAGWAIAYGIGMLTFDHYWSGRGAARRDHGPRR